MDRVNIILCTYNGEKYIRQLLDSLLAQTYKHISIWVRDDGSTDGTVRILQEYIQMNPSGIVLCLVEDAIGNLGYVKNFLHTIRASGDADFYAFCDQDDYWLPDKIARAVEALKEQPSEKCLLYSSGYEARNAKMEYISKGRTPTPFDKLDVGKALSLFDGGWLLGFTLVMNRTLKQKAFDNNAQEMYSHDIWAQAVAVGFGGELIFDEHVTAYFRRHEYTTSIAESVVSHSRLDAWKYRWDEFFGKGKTFSRLKSGMLTYAALYSGKVHRKRDQRFLRDYANPSRQSTNRFCKVLYPHRLKQSLLVELVWRLSILRGKL